MKYIITILLLLSGCSMFKPSSAPFSGSIGLPSGMPAVGAEGSTGFEILPWLGGVAVLAGIALIVISGGRKGWYPLCIGVGLIILNWLVLTYAHALFIPVVIATGALTLALGYKVVSSILSHRKTCK